MTQVHTYLPQITARYLSDLMPYIFLLHSINAWKWKVKVKSLSRVRPFETPWTAAHQAPPSMGFSRQEWSAIAFSEEKKLLQKFNNTVVSSVCFHLIHVRSSSNHPGLAWSKGNRLMGLLCIQQGLGVGLELWDPCPGVIAMVPQLSREKVKASQWLGVQPLCSIKSERQIGEWGLTLEP